MFLKNLKLTNFRNYNKLDLNLKNGINIIIGNNAVGKTNILESIYVLGLTKSFRTNNDRLMIKNECNFCKIKAESDSDIFEFFLNETEKIVRINKNRINKISDYVSKLNVVVYNPESIKLISGLPNERRKIINVDISQLDNKYLNILNEFNKILKIRNNLLKKNINKNKIYFNIINEKFVEKSLYIYKKRFEFVELINLNIDGIYEKITSDKNLKIKYINNFNLNYYNEEQIKNELFKLLNSNLDKEIHFGSTLYGPHKDEWIFNLSDVDLRIYGSEGQKKSLTLSFVLAEIEIFKLIKNNNPILLLDDIFSELDLIKKNNIIKFLDKNIQTIITTTDLKNFNKKIINNSKIFNIENNEAEERC